MQNLMEIQKQNGCLSCLIYEARSQCFQPDLILAKIFDGKITVFCYRDLLVLWTEPTIVLCHTNRIVREAHQTHVSIL